MAKIDALINEKEANIEVADSVKLTYKEGASLKAEIYGKSVSRYLKGDNKLIFEKGIEVRFYDAGQLSSVLSADSASYDDNLRTILIKGNVDMYNYKHEELSTDELLWDMNTKMIFAKNHIKIKTPHDIVRGSGMIAKEDLSQYSIKRVFGTVAYDDEERFR